MSHPSTPVLRSIPALLAAQATSTPDAPAIGAPGRATLTYGSLWAHVQETAAALIALGIGRADRLAVVLPNGPEMAVAFLAAACAATSAPLNPAYREGDFEFYLSDLQARALLLPAGAQSPARNVAARLGIPVLELVPSQEAEAGRFALRSQELRPTAPGGLATAEDLALVLHTSGTTSRPKAVPLTHANLCAWAHNIQRTLQLMPADRCLNVLPLFHIHGLVAALLSSLTAGASICCTPGFDAAPFFAWLQESQATWYTAVPTMHQAILRQAAVHHEIIARTPLRFIRSSSAALPRKLMAELESTFGARVIEAYGMTEAAHQIASNPLPPGERKPSSVGPAAGPKLAVVDEAGSLQPTGETGEVVIRGPNVMGGYLNNPESNANAFVNGWFRTGDQGYLDRDGYLFLVGRIKEIINRGGEKANPVEVDGVLLKHPAVAQAVTFPVPHPTLGEDVLAAVVLRDGASATDRDLRAFAFSHLAGFKVPTQVLIVPEIPKGPTGKVQRLVLAQQLAAIIQPEFAVPKTLAEQALAGLWSELLGMERVGVHDNFFALGGDSLQAGRLVTRVRAAFGVELPLSAVFREPTLAEQTAAIESLMAQSVAALTDDQARALLD